MWVLERSKTVNLESGTASWSKQEPSTPQCNTCCSLMVVSLCLGGTARVLRCRAPRHKLECPTQFSDGFFKSKALRNPRHPLADLQIWYVCSPASLLLLCAQERRIDFEPESCWVCVTLGSTGLSDHLPDQQCLPVGA